MSSSDGCQHALTAVPEPTGPMPIRALSRTATERQDSLAPPRQIDSLLKHSLILTLATGTMNVASWLYHLIMSRALGPAEYGALSALIGLLLILTVPVNAVQMGMSAFVARATANGQQMIVTSILNRTLKGSLLVGAVAFVALALISGWLAEALKLGSSVPVLMVGTVLTVHSGWAR